MTQQPKNAEEIALQVESDIKAAARKWKREHAAHKGYGRGRINYDGAATEIAAWYLHEHIELFHRSTIEDTRNAHEMWMMLMKQWFFDVVKPKAQGG